MTSRAFVARGLEGATNARFVQMLLYYEITAHPYGTNYTVENLLGPLPRHLVLTAIDQPAHGEFVPTARITSVQRVEIND